MIQSNVKIQTIIAFFILTVGSLASDTSAGRGGGGPINEVIVNGNGHNNNGGYHHPSPAHSAPPGSQPANNTGGAMVFPTGGVEKNLIDEIITIAEQIIDTEEQDDESLARYAVSLAELVAMLSKSSKNGLKFILDLLDDILEDKQNESVKQTFKFCESVPPRNKQMREFRIALKEATGHVTFPDQEWNGTDSGKITVIYNNGFGEYVTNTYVPGGIKETHWEKFPFSGC